MPQVQDIAFRAVSAVATGTTSLTISRPTGVVDGDFLVMCLSHKGTDYATVPAGWTLVAHDVDAVSGIRGEMYWKRASSEGSSYSVTGLSDTACGLISAYLQVVGSGDPVNVVITQVNAFPTSAVGALTTTVPMALLVAMGAASVNAGTVMLYGVGATPLPTGGAAFNNGDPDLKSMGTRLQGGTSNGTDCSIVIADAIKIIPGSTISTVNCTLLSSTAHAVCIVAAFVPETAGATSGTRYYLSSKQPGPPRREPWAYDGDWANTFDDGRLPETHGPGVFQSYLLSQTKADAGPLFHPPWATNLQGDYDILVMRYLTPPLQAQTLSGTIDVCLGLALKWLGDSGFTTDSVGRLKLHVYVTQGQTTTTRTVLVDNYIDSTDITKTGAGVWTGLTTPQSVAGSITAGDSLVVELGVRVVSSPTPTPTYPPTEYSELTWVGRGATDNRGSLATSTSGVPFPDAVPAGTNMSQVPYLTFTDTILEQTAPASPANVTPSAATVVPTVPYSEAAYDTRGATSNARSVWYAWTPTRSGTAILQCIGSNGNITIEVYTGDPSSYSTLNNATGWYTFTNQTSLRSSTLLFLPTIAHATYYIRLHSTGNNGYTAASSGGAWRLGISFRETPQADDVFLPATNITVWRDGALVNATPDLSSWTPSGVAIDYTQRPMTALTGEINTNYRLYVNLFGSSPLTEILDLTTLNLDTPEIDFILDPYHLSGGGSTPNVGALQMTTAGMLYSQTFGDGFLSVCGLLSGIPAYMEDPSDFARFSAVRGIDGTHADDQPTAPFALASELNPTVAVTAPWTGGLDETQQILQYASGGLYTSLGVETARRFNLTTSTQLADGPTLSPTGPNPDVRGMCAIPAYLGGGWLLCNGNVVQRVSVSGTVIATYTPTTDYSTTLVDVRLVSDGSACWALSNDAVELFKFSLASGAQIGYVWTGQGAGNAIQLAIFTPPTSIVVPDPTPVHYVIRRLRQAPHLSDEQRRMRHTQFQLDVEAGLGVTSGQGVDPTIYLSWSDDGGHRWSNEYPMTIGRLGDYKKRVLWRRLGITRDRVYRVTMSDPVRWVLLDAYLELVAGNGT